MKKITSFLILLLAVVSVKAQSLKVTGELKNLADNTQVSLLDGMTNKEVATGTSKDGKFTLTGKADNITVFVLGFKGLQQKVPVFMGNEEVVLTGDVADVNNIQFKGSATQDVYISFMKLLTPLIEPYFKTMQAAQAEKEASKKDSLNKKASELTASLLNGFASLSSANSQSPVSTFFLLQLANIFPAIKENMAAIYSSFGGEAKKGPFAEILDKMVQSADLGKIGSVLPEFKQNDVNGKSVSLSSLRGKYVLIDFWASWCGPCRAENPNVVKTFNAYKNKNFTVLGVSLDQDKAKWLEAIKKDGLTWTHVSDLKYWNNEVAVQFGIQSIPANFLIDPKGVIIGKDLRGPDLEKILAANIK
jgi:peroxiredoxin